KKALFVVLVFYCSLLMAKREIIPGQQYESNKEFDLFFKLVKTVTLSQEKVLLGSVRKLSIGPDGNFWILDSKSVKIHKFRADGTFISSIGGKGQGPGEYLIPMDIFIGNKYIYVVDPGARKINVLNMDGSFKYFFKIQDGRSVQESKNGDIVIAAPLITNPNDSTCIQIYTNKGGLKRSFIPIARNAVKHGLISDFVSFSLDQDDNIYCVQEMEYKIYKYSFDGQVLKNFSQIKPYYTSPPDELFKQKYLQSATENWLKSWTHIIGIIYFNKLLFVTLSYPKGEYEHIIDIYSQEGEFIKGGLAMNYRLLHIDKKGNFYFLQDKTDLGAFDSSYNILIYSIRDSNFFAK
ncbi:MAG TPA: 6-bladed beta-propeller, partial [Candidatus Kapabacteria bacterium]|nr:6-bladed beta-propeller [Candidatus Kapabacteria bacterium]